MTHHPDTAGLARDFVLVAVGLAALAVGLVHARRESGDAVVRPADPRIEAGTVKESNAN